MRKTFNRENDILNLIAQLDISPSLYKNAEDKYKALASFLENNGISADIYPQGSFAFGTVVRPTVKNPDANYDLDFICQLHLTRDDISPSKLRQKIETILKSSNRYEGKLVKCGECFTIEYADINGIGFSIDIVPATDESSSNKNELMSISNNPHLLTTAIAIPRQNNARNYNWITNNPKGFKSWFDNINKAFLEYDQEARRAKYFSKHRYYYNSVDEIPPALERSALQRVIQLMKYHRDVYYQNIFKNDSDELKPISAIINTLVAGIAKDIPPTSDVFSLLAQDLDELCIYALQEVMDHNTFCTCHTNRTAISHANNTWIIQNPANPKDNLADKWNSNPDIPKYFFKWINACRVDLVESLQLPDDEFRIAMENAFGADTIHKNWGTKYQARTPKPINVSTASKPYRAV